MLNLNQWSLALLVRESQRRIEISKLAGLWDSPAVLTLDSYIQKLLAEMTGAGPQSSAASRFLLAQYAELRLLRKWTGGTDFEGKTP